MSDGALVDIWEFPCDFDLAKIVAIAQDRLAPPDLRGQIASSRGDVLTLQVIEGRAPDAPKMRLYVSDRGAFEILRRERWPGGRELLAPRAWPCR